jgi:hypothetical protein
MQKFSLNHIKSFKDSTEIELKPITILVGKNSSGKSSLLRFPVVLAQTFREDTFTPLLLFGNMIDYGNYDDVAYRHGDNPLGFRISFGPELKRFARFELSNWSYRFFRDNQLFRFDDYNMVALSVYIDKPEKKLEVKSLELELDGRKLCTIQRDEESRNLSIMIHQFYGESGWEEESCEFLLEDVMFSNFIPIFDFFLLVDQYCIKEHIVSPSGKSIRDTYKESLFLSQDEYIANNIYPEKQNQFRKCYVTFAVISVYLSAIRWQLKSDAESIAYIGPFRDNPKRTYRDSERSYNDVGVNGENTSMLLRQAAQGDKKLLEDVSGWLKTAMGYALDIKEVGNGLYSLVVQENEETDNIIDVGFGISQVLPIDGTTDKG